MEIGEKVDLAAESRPGRRRLALRVQRDFNTYLWGALPLCVVLSSERLHPWYYEHFFQLYSELYPSGPEPLHVDFSDAFGYSEVLAVSVVDRAAAGRLGSIVDFIRSCIDSESYCTVFLDQNSLSGSHPPRVHEFLLFGYDDDSRTFDAVGFAGDEVLVFSTQRFDYDAFGTAFQRGLRTTTRDSLCSPIQLLRLRAAEYAFDVSRIARQLRDYLTGPGDDPRAAGPDSWWWSLKLRGDWWNEPLAVAEIDPGLQIRSGVGVYDHLLAHLAAVVRGDQPIDYRVFHLLFEHKRSILRRLEFVRDEYGPRADLDEAIAGFRRLTTVTKKFRLDLLLSTYRNTLGPVADGSRLLRDVRRAEVRLLEPVCGLLERL
jgi:hypothetical protein